MRTLIGVHNMSDVICCDNCKCILCDFWKSCNDNIYYRKNWCEVCNDMDIDRCFTIECDSIVTKKVYLTHPIYKFTR